MDILELQDLVDNPTPRVPVGLCLDCSASMRGAPLAELNAGVEAFYRAIYRDEIARYSAEVSIVTFGPVRLETGFMTLDRNSKPPRLGIGGATPLGEAVRLSLDCLERRKAEYRKNGIDYYQPWLVLMTDGAPYGGSQQVLDEQVRRVRELVLQRKLAVFAIGVGQNADMDALACFSPNRPPLRLRGLNFSFFFQWLSSSVSRVSQSIPGDAVPLDVEGIKGWAEL